MNQSTDTTADTGAAATGLAIAQAGFAIGVMGMAAVGFFAPGLFTWRWNGFEPRQAIVPLVQLTMLGMGITLTASDFRRVLATPVVIALGVALQFGIMPLAGWIFTRLFGLSGEVAAGLILVGSCPGGVASNVITYVAGANVSLSVTLTACTTILSPLVTPLAMRWLAGRDVQLDTADMFWSIVWVILAPVALGLVLNRLVPAVARRLAAALPPVAMGSICLIIAITVALARDDLTRVGPPLVAAAICHNALGFLLGYAAARAARLDVRDSRTLSIEVGMQNGGMATALALGSLHSPSAALAAAVFGPWSAFAAAMLAVVWSRRPPAAGLIATAALEFPEET
jgi:BASS family bile acid:Na+ symporter